MAEVVFGLPQLSRNFAFFALKKLSLSLPEGERPMSFEGFASLIIAGRDFGCSWSIPIRPLPSEETKMIQMRPATISMILAAAMFAIPALASAQASTGTRTGRAMANGVNYYYEIHGKGEPLLLVHGGLGSIDMFGPILPMLAKSRQVIAVDLHGHGRTELGSRPIDLIDIGNDLAVVLKQLGYGAVDVMGYSFGAGAAKGSQGRVSSTG